MDQIFSGQGAEVLPQGVRYAAWAPGCQSVWAEILTSGGGVARSIPLVRNPDGFFHGIDPAGRAGDHYKLRPEGGEALPPPASRWQPLGVQGPAAVVDAAAWRWEDHAWQRPAFRDLVIYELHLGTFTPAGTFRSAIERLPDLQELGVNAIEIMPVADFPGERGWGYDGVQPYAPARCYGTPDDLRALVEAAHAHGLAVILDVVYNHFGPDGNYLTSFSPHYFSSHEKTPWGDAINFGHEHSRPVRDFVCGNLAYWMDEFHLDGFRLDATHAIMDPSGKHILQELAETVHARGGYIIAEDERNEARIVSSPESGGFGFNAVWADDFHHTVEVATIEASVYRKDFTGELPELVRALEHGWIYCGQNTLKRNKPRGTPTTGVPPERFIFCISNHDQVGNRALGERLNHLVQPATYRAASALLLLAPYTPLLFMGQEWAASTPFQYFTDHQPELGKLVEQGRREEFKEAFAHHQELAASFPSPQAEDTFLHSKLRWEEIGEPPHAGVRELYRTLIQLRREHPEFRPAERGTVTFSAHEAGVLVMRVGAEWLLLCDLQGGHEGAVEGSWQVAVSSNEGRFGGDGGSSFADGRFHFTQAEVLLLKSDTSAGEGAANGMAQGH